MTATVVPASNETFTAHIQSIAAGGSGVTRLNGKTVFADFTAPGDFARLRITKDHKTWADAELIEVIKPSPERIPPACELYGRCGGCNFQHLNYKAQLSAKTEILLQAFLRIGGIKVPEIKCRESAPFEYRNRFQFHSLAVGTGTGGFGFKERRSQAVVTLNDCPVACKPIRNALRHGTFDGAAGENPIKENPMKNRFNVYAHGDTFLVEGKNEKGRVSLLDKEISLNVKLFFQSNAAMLESLITDLTEIAKSADPKLPFADIYCGVGTFAAFLHEGFCETVLVEENKNALLLARENLSKSGKASDGKAHSFFALTDTAWVKTLNQQGKKQKWGFMALDPPRDGLSAPFAAWLSQNGPKVLAYVSCNPATLARDSRILLNGAYTLSQLSMYDFYPQTAHIESLALFLRV
ncbi:MAG: TRAM domain-containing protein [Treponema sp.]|nr:TRAM domain-containing protein [Treponema sp.]